MQTIFNIVLLCIIYLLSSIHSFLPSDVEEVHTASQYQFFLVALAAVFWHQPVCQALPGMSPYLQAVICQSNSEIVHECFGKTNDCPANNDYQAISC